jgi:Flp pilus assembly protein TadD
MTEEAGMQEVEKYRQFARECLRLAATAKPADKTVLLNIAEAWEQQAKIAEAATVKKTEAKPDGHDVKR